MGVRWTRWSPSSDPPADRAPPRGRPSTGTTMLLLTAPFDPCPPRPTGRSGTSGGAVAGAATLALIAAGLVAEISGALPGHVGRGVASAAVHRGVLPAGGREAAQPGPRHG